MKSTSTSTSGTAREVGEEDQRALEHADEHDPVGVVDRDALSQVLHPAGDVALVEQRARLGHRGVPVRRG